MSLILCRYPLGVIFIGLTVGLSSGTCSTLYQTGFEPPTFSVGALNGQDGWSADTTATVETTTVDSGLQAVQFSAALANGVVADLAVQSNSYAITNPQTIVTISDNALFSSAASFSNWIPLEVFVNAPPVLWFIVDPSGQLTGTGITPGTTLSRNTWYQFSMQLDFKNSLATEYLNGASVGSFTLPSSSTPFFGGVAFGVGSTLGRDLMFVDNVSVSSVSTTPDPQLCSLVYYPQWA